MSSVGFFYENRHLSLRSLKVFISIQLLLAVISFSASASADTHGSLRLVKGDVKIRSAQSGQVSAATQGDKIYAKDTIITAADSRARIEMKDGNQINILPETQMTLEQYIHQPESERKQVLLNVISGRVRAKVEEKYDGEGQSFQIKTPTAVAGVRGTDFLTGYSNGTTEVVTFSGEVEFGLPGPGNSIVNSQILGPGTISRSEGGQPPVPPQMAPSEVLQEVEAELVELEAEVSTMDSGTDSQVEAQTDSPTDSPETAESELTSGDSTVSESQQEGSGSREPAAQESSGGDMLLSEDLPGGENAPPPPPLANMAPSLPNADLPRSVVDTINQCEFCNRVIEEGADKLIIRWTQPQ